MLRLLEMEAGRGLSVWSSSKTAQNNSLVRHHFAWLKNLGTTKPSYGIDVKPLMLNGVECTIIGVFNAAEDKAARRRVFREDVDWCSTALRVRSRWRPPLSVAFWVACFLA